MRHVMCGLGEKMTTAEINILIDGMEDMHGLVSSFYELGCPTEKYNSGEIRRFYQKTYVRRPILRN